MASFQQGVGVVPRLFQGLRLLFLFAIWLVRRLFSLRSSITDFSMAMPDCLRRLVVGVLLFNQPVHFIGPRCCWRTSCWRTASSSCWALTSCWCTASVCCCCSSSCCWVFPIGIGDKFKYIGFFKTKQGGFESSGFHGHAPFSQVEVPGSPPPAIIIIIPQNGKKATGKAGKTAGLGKMSFSRIQKPAAASLPEVGCYFE